MTGLLNFAAGFRCPNCKSRQEYWHVRKLLWINRIWPLFVKSYGNYFKMYKEPELGKVRCYSCKMDLRVPKGTMVKLEVLCWGIACAIFYAIMNWALHQSALAGPPSWNGRNAEEILRSIEQRQSGNDPYSGRLPLIILAVCVAAPVSYVIGRFLSYRIVRLERNPRAAPLMPPVFEN